MLSLYYNAWQFKGEQLWPHKDIHLKCFADDLLKAGGAFALPISMFLFTLCQSFKMRLVVTYEVTYEVTYKVHIRGHIRGAH